MELDWLLLSVTGILLILVLYLNFILHRTGRQLEEQVIHFQQLQQDFGVLCTDRDELGNQIVRLDQRVKKLAEWQDQINLHTPEARAYSQAIKMVRSGADIDQLVARCGLSQNEAELVYLLHNASSEPNTVPGQVKARTSLL